MKEWIRTNVSAELTEATTGKTIEKVIDDDGNGMDDWIQFVFTDGSVLRIRYDWIYEWELEQKAS